MEQRFSDLIILLSSGINQRRMYFDKHPNVQSISCEFVSKLQDLLSGAGPDVFSFGVYNSKFIREGKFLVGPSIAGRSLIEFAEHLCCGGFGFQLPITESDLITFFRLAAAQKDDLENLETARAFFAAAGLGHIELLLPFSEDEAEGGAAPGGLDSENKTELDFMASDFAPLLQAYQSLYETVATNNRSISNESALDLDQAHSRGEELVAVSNKGALDVMQFMRYPDFDSYTIGHSVRVAALGALLARQLGWSRDLQNEIATAGLLHDLGKGKISEGILFKPGKLSSEERRVMETHPALGVRILLANGETSSIVLSSAWGHHLREDGGGYPKMASWYQRSSAASLIHVCDVFEALTAVRPYKSAMCPRRAYEIMVQDKGAFQPRMLAVLIRTLGLYPPGSEVLLSDKRRAVVVSKGKTPELPMVRITHDARGVRLTSENQPALDLHENSGIRIADLVQIGVEMEESSEFINT